MQNKTKEQALLIPPEFAINLVFKLIMCSPSVYTKGKHLTIHDTIHDTANYNPPKK